MKLGRLILILYLDLFCLSLFAQENVDHTVIGRIKEEGFQHSQVMETVSWLSDVYGPRLFASPGYLEAAEWAKKEMGKWGLQNVSLDTLDGNFRGWSVQSFSMEMLEPKYTRIVSYPKAWTSSTDGEVSGTPIILSVESRDGIPLLDSLQKFHGKLTGKIVFVDIGKKVKPSFEAFTTRFPSEELMNAEQQIDTVPEDYIGLLNKLNLKEQLTEDEEYVQRWRRVDQFFIDEAAAALVMASDFTHGILHVDGTYYAEIGDIKPLPTFIISNEQFNRILRMKDKGITPIVKLHLKTKFYEEKKYQVNVLAELPGSDKKLKQEIVMIGAHFDSWHSGTGATDNAVGAAVTMEVMRILKAVEAKPRRTIRICLWSGEEQAYYGSMDYVGKYVGDVLTGEHKSEQSKISAYFNLDNGSGKIRGIYLQGNESVRHIFVQLLAPFAYLSANTLTSQNTVWTDHTIFDSMNIPAFQFIQDPLNTMTITHHTNMDVYEYVIEDDLKQNAVIIASLVYHIATRNEMLPRKTTKE